MAAAVASVRLAVLSVLATSVVVGMLFLLRPGAGEPGPVAGSPIVADGEHGAATLPAAPGVESSRVEAGPTHVPAPVRKRPWDPARPWIVRGLAWRGAKGPYPGLRLEAQLFDGVEAAGPPTVTTELCCDDDGRFTWLLPAPRRAITLRLSCATPRHSATTITVRASPGEEPPQGLLLHAWPLDSVATGTVLGTDGMPVPRASVRTQRERVECDGQGRFRLEFCSVGAATLSACAPGHAQERRSLEGDPGEVHLEFLLRKAGRLAGRVVDEQGLPIAGATVSSMVAFMDPAITDGNGRFELDVDPEQDGYPLTARANGYVGVRKSVNFKERAQELELILSRGVGVEGRVFGPKGEPIAGAELNIGSSTTDTVTVTSQLDGSFRFPTVSSGRMTLTTRRCGFARDVRDVEVTKDIASVRADVVLQEGRLLAGTVVDEDDTPMANVMVGVREVGAGWLDGNVHTGADGAFRIEHLPARNLQLTFDREGYLRHELSCPELDCDDLRAVMRRSARLVGRVVDHVSGAPIPVFRIRFLPGRLAPGERQPDGVVTFWGGEGWLIRDAQGRWDSRRQAFVPGTIVGVEAIAEGYAPARNLHVVAAHDPYPEACVLRLTRGGMIQGRVLERAGGAPVASASVRRFEHDEEVKRPDVYRQPRVLTDADGRFQIERVPPGTWRLAVEAPGHPLHLEPPFEVVNEQRVDHTIMISAGASISGLALVDGQPAVDATLYLFPRQPSRRFPVTQTGVDGSFQFTGLESGDYEISGWGLRDGAATSWTRFVTLAADQRLELRLEATGNGAVQGELESDGPLPASISVMLVTKVEKERSRAYRAVALNGKFHIRGIPAGEYSVHVPGQMENTRVMVTDGATASVRVRVKR